MSNSIFANQAQVREREQEKIEKKVERANAPRKTERTTLSLSITKADKEWLMDYADETGVSAAGMIHQLIHYYRKNEGG